MALICRVQQSKMIQSSQKFSLFHFHVPWVSEYAPSSSGRLAFGSPLTDLLFGVRFFAAPAQALKNRDEDKALKGPRMNDQLTEDFVRLVIDERHGIVPRHLALLQAKRLKLDLVEVSRDAEAEHPVCKIIDFHMEKYRKQLKGKEKAKSTVTLRKGECKEVRFSGKTELKDLKVKADAVKRLMERGYRVKCVATGKEGQDLGGMLSRLSDLIDDVAFVESGPKVESHQAYLIVRHIKFGTPKKSGKKASTAVTTDTVMQNVAPSNALGYADSIESSEETDSEDSGLESDSENNKSDELSVSSPAQGKTAWSALGTRNNISDVIDLSDGVKKPVSSADQHAKLNSRSPFSGAAPSFPDVLPSKIPDFQGPRFGTPLAEPENRYKQNVVRKGPGTTDPARHQNQGVLRFGTDPTLPNSRLARSGSYNSQIPDLGRKPEPQGSIPSRIGGSAAAPNQEPSRYGIFSNHNTASPGNPGSRDRILGGNNPIGLPRKPGPATSAGNLNSPTPSSGGGQWGIFSADIPNPSTGKISESQGKVQR